MPRHRLIQRVILIAAFVLAPVSAAVSERASRKANTARNNIVNKDICGDLSFTPQRTVIHILQSPRSFVTCFIFCPIVDA
jgi:hypothetical protein